MKQITLFATAIALTLCSLVGTAGTVTGLTTYNSGATLTADQLNKNNTQIKSAVDDNATSIAGKVDKAGDTMTGSLTAPGFNYDLDQVRYAVVGMDDFVPQKETFTYIRYSNLLTPTFAGNSYFYAPVHLPNGAVITAVDFYTYDGSTTSRIEWGLYETVQETGVVSLTVATAGGDVALSPGLQNLSIPSLFHTVDNSQYFYRMSLFFSGPTNMGFISARITYIVGKPD